MQAINSGHAFLAAIDACAALHFGATAEHFARAYAVAFGAAHQLQPWLTETMFRESFFRTVSRRFGGEAGSRNEQAVAAHAVVSGRRALAACFAMR